MAHNLTNGTSSLGRNSKLSINRLTVPDDDISKFTFVDSGDELDSDPDQNDFCHYSTCTSSTDKDWTIRPRRRSFSFNSSGLSSKFKPFSEKRTVKWIKKHFLPHPVKLKERHYRRLKKLCAHGLPARQRCLIWYLLTSRLSTAPLISSSGKALFPEDNESFDDYLMQVCRSYSSVNPNPKWADLILRDLRRCIPDDDNFNNANGIGYKALNKVLFAFSVHNAHVGYCQGLGPLVAFILNIFNQDIDLEENEDWEWERTFWVLHYLNSDNRYMRDYNTPGLEGVIVDMWLFGEMVRKYLPKQHKILTRLGFDPTLYAQSWFFCLFVRTLPVELCARIWDIYICEGKFVMFKTALIILYTICHKSKELLKEEQVEEFLNALQHPDPAWFKTEKFIEKVVKFRIDAKWKRKFLEQAESYRYEQFGAKHTITSNAPELAYDNEVDPISELESDRNLSDEDEKSSRNLQMDDNEYPLTRVGTDFVTTGREFSAVKKSFTLGKLDLSTNLVGADELLTPVANGDGHASIILSKVNDDSSSNHSPIALSACSSSTSEHKEQMQGYQENV